MKLLFAGICWLLLYCAYGQNSPPTSTPSWTPPPVQRASEGTQHNAVVDGNTAFALNLYHQLRTQPGNLVLSPYSISTALAMTYAGARGQTEKQMAKTMHFGLPQKQLHPAFAQLQASLHAAQSSSAVRLLVASSLWPAKGVSLKRDFLALMEQNYQTRLTPLDYVQTETARQTINRWVERKTQDKIKELIGPGLLGPDTVLVLANAIYFKGDWATPFKPQNTRVRPFHLSSSKKITAPTMAATFGRLSQCGYYANAEVSLLELPYQGGEISLVVLLPKRVDGLAGLEQGLSLQKLRAWLADLGGTGVEVWLPKFKTTSFFELKEKLEALGMVNAFGAADFSGIFGTRGPHISAVLHKAFVEVNEEGTEAAAATAVPMEVSAPPQFHADHPFLFLIRHRSTGSILFLGRVADPTDCGPS